MLLTVWRSARAFGFPPAARATAGFVWPEQIHMSITGLPGEAVIEWVSSAPVGTSAVEISDRQGCCDASFTPPAGPPMKCPCFPFSCWRQNFTCATLASEAACTATTGSSGCTWVRKAAVVNGSSGEGHSVTTGRCVGPLWQNVTTIRATDWFGSAMPRNASNGEPQEHVAGVSEQRLWMDEPSNPAAQNYTLHQALVKGLTPGTQYYYRVGFGDSGPTMVDSRGGDMDPAVGGWSDIISFTAFPPDHREPIWAVFGDMGATTDEFRGVAPSIPVLQQDQADDMYDGVIHAGDYAYDMAPYGGRVGDRFMNLVQPFASRVPYMAGIGNHESGGSNRKHFSMRFAGMQYAGLASNASNAGNTENGDQLWFSWDAGLVHWIAINTELWNCPHMAPGGNTESFWSSVWNPKTNRSLVDEFMPWLEADLAKANANRESVPWIVGFAHKGWYMQPEVNFSMIDDALHRGGVDLFFGGHIHVYQRFFPLRTAPYGPNASKPNNRPADIDFDCASTENGPDYDHAGLIANNTYINPKYMATIIVGGPGDPEVTPETNSGECAGNMTWYDYESADTAASADSDEDSRTLPKTGPNPMAMCRDNYGYGYLQAVNHTHLHWTWKMTGVGTPKHNVGKLPPKSSIPPAALVDELWMIKDVSRARPKDHGNGNPMQGPRSYDAPRTSWDQLESGNFEEYRPPTGSTFQLLYDINRDEWQPEGCGELVCRDP